MRLHETPLAGAFVIDIEPQLDDRGFFARTWCQQEFATRGIELTVRQCNLSVNRSAYTLRGLHYRAGQGEARVVSCTRGAIFDVIVDLRPTSPTFKDHFAVELNDDNRRMLYVPPGMAHGFETLRDNTEVQYLMSEFYDPQASRGVRWDDPAFAVCWPAPPRVMSEHDRAYEDFHG